MGKPTVLLSIETFAETASEAFGRRFIDCLTSEDARLVPELVSDTERFKDPFVDAEHFIEKWWAMPYKMYLDGKFVSEGFHGPMWKRKSVLVSRGMVKHGRLNVKGKKIGSDIWFESQWRKDLNFFGLFERWIGISNPNVGMLHVFTDVERNMLRAQDGLSFEVGSFGGPAKPGLPEMGWAMAYGPEYAAEVDVGRIAGAGFKVSEIGGAQVVQVTDRLADVVDDYASFARRRAELKSLFRPDLFWIK
jgi:hypothetical protein